GHVDQRGQSRNPDAASDDGNSSGAVGNREAVPERPDNVAAATFQDGRGHQATAFAQDLVGDLQPAPILADAIDAERPAQKGREAPLDPDVHELARLEGPGDLRRLDLEEPVVTSQRAIARYGGKKLMHVAYPTEPD